MSSNLYAMWDYMSRKLYAMWDGAKGVHRQSVNQQTYIQRYKMSSGNKRDTGLLKSLDRLAAKTQCVRSRGVWREWILRQYMHAHSRLHVCVESDQGKKRQVV